MFYPIHTIVRQGDCSCGPNFMGPANLVQYLEKVQRIRVSQHALCWIGQSSCALEITPFHMLDCSVYLPH
jgi:hypothetical protein